MRQVDHRIYAEQSDDVTRIMMKVDGDPPVCLFSYSRALAKDGRSLTAIDISGSGKEQDYIGVAIMFSKEAGQVPLTNGDANGRQDDPHPGPR